MMEKLFWLTSYSTDSSLLINIDSVQMMEQTSEDGEIYTRIHFSQDDNVLVKESLKQIVEQLSNFDDSKFIVKKD